MQKEEGKRKLKPKKKVEFRVYEVPIPNSNRYFKNVFRFSDMAIFVGRNEEGLRRFFLKHTLKAPIIIDGEQTRNFFIQKANKLKDQGNIKGHDKFILISEKVKNLNRYIDYQVIMLKTFIQRAKGIRKKFIRYTDKDIEELETKWEYINKLAKEHIQRGIDGALSFDEFLAVKKVKLKDIILGYKEKK